MIFLHFIKIAVISCVCWLGAGAFIMEVAFADPVLKRKETKVLTRAYLHEDANENSKIKLANLPIKKLTKHESFSGFPLPRFVSLKYSKARGRVGPGIKYPTLWEYHHVHLPLLVIGETKTWRMVRDINGDESWMHIRLLDGKRTVITLKKQALRARPRVTAARRAVIDKGVVLYMHDCMPKWCAVRDLKTKIKGYVRTQDIWGDS